MSAVRRHPIITFFVLAYALTWGAIPWESFLATGPLLAALIVIPLTQGWAGLRDLGSRMIRWRVGWIWYALAIGLPLAVHLLTVVLNVALGAPAPSLAQFSPWYTVLVAHATEGSIQFGAFWTAGAAARMGWLLYAAAWCAVANGLVVFDWQFWRGPAPAPATVQPSYEGESRVQ